MGASASRVAAALAAMMISAVVALTIPASAQPAEVVGREDAHVTSLKTTNLRYDEDYSYLRNPAKRTGAWWERYKYVPLSFSDDAYLSLGLELRFREEAYRQYNWGELSVNEYQWYRTLPYADLHLGSNLRLFGQVIGAWVTDKEAVGVSTPRALNCSRVLRISSCHWSVGPILPCGEGDNFCLMARSD